MRDFTNQYIMDVLINGSPVDEYEHQGNVFIEGRYGSEYQIRIRNKTPNKALFVVSVDGLSILDGNPAGLGSEGYVVDGYGTMVIPGWHLNNTEVAKFVFGDESKSYSNKSGRGKDNTGVIGLLVFKDKVIQPPLVEYPLTTSSVVYDSASTSTTRSANVNMTSEMGTEFGESTSMYTKEVAFERRDPNHPDSFVTIFYDSARGLEKRGIVLKHKQEATPNPFPSYYSNTGCRPPSDWKR